MAFGGPVHEQHAHKPNRRACVRNCENKNIKYAYYKKCRVGGGSGAVQSSVWDKFIYREHNTKNMQPKYIQTLILLSQCKLVVWVSAVGGGWLQLFTPPNLVHNIMEQSMSRETFNQGTQKSLERLITSFNHHQFF